MIAILSVVLFIVSEYQEVLASSNKTLQKGKAISKLNDDEFQIYNYSLFLPFNNDGSDGESEEVDNEAIQPFE